MKNKSKYGLFIVSFIVGSFNGMVACEKESTGGFLPQIVQPSSKPSKMPASLPKNLASSASASVVLRITSSMPDLAQKPGIARVSTQGSSMIAKSPRYEGLLVSPVLSGAGSSMVGTSPRLDRAGIKLTSISSSVVPAASPSGFEVGSKK